MPGYDGWRRRASPESLELLDFYARYLAGQYAGMSEALNLDAVRAALDIERVPPAAWPEMTRRLILFHRACVAALPSRGN